MRFRLYSVRPPKSSRTILIFIFGRDQIWWARSSVGFGSKKSTPNKTLLPTTVCLLSSTHYTALVLRHFSIERCQHTKQNLINFFLHASKYLRIIKCSRDGMFIFFSLFGLNQGLLASIYYTAIYSTHLSKNGIPYHEMPIVCWTIDVRQIQIRFQQVRKLK